ncbi:MAG: hypothetical protein J5476_12795 [Lachnospiraceae bacterium]|nr:hypothetical protein [Lachnospiraceae bacterium]
MKNEYKNYLFDKHILVNEGNVEAMLKFIEERLDVNVSEPFYKNFPQSVKTMTPDQLILDQIVHYARTYGLGDFSEPGHSIFEGEAERTEFNESVEDSGFRAVSEEEAYDLLAGYVNDLLAGTRPLSDVQFELVKNYIEDFKLVPKKIASKNTAVKLLISLRDPMFADYIAMSDVIRLVDEMNYSLYENKNIKKLNLRNQDRKLITAIIDKLFESGRVDVKNCFEKQKLWSGLLHHLHYKAKTEEAKEFLDAMRGRENNSVYSEFEKAISEKDIRSAVDIIKAGKGSAALIRNLNYLISRCESTEDIEYICGNMETDNLIVLIQLLIQYSQMAGKGTTARTFAFTKYNMLKVHTETEEEQKKRKSMITEGQANMLAAKIRANLEKQLKNRLGKVYIDPDMVNYALPIQENTSQGGFGVLTRGSRIRIPETKKIRAFTYWEKVDDIDLSVFGIDDEGHETEFSWRTMAESQSEAITYSGDETSGYKGGSEFFDIDLDEFRKLYPKVHYMIFCDNVFSRTNFDRCFCKAGYMTRDLEDSGKVYEPKTVKSSFTVNSASTFAYLFGIDIRTNDFIWLNMSRDSKAAVAGDTSMDFLTDYFHVTDIINVHSFFEMMATEVVSDISEAEVVVTNKEVECPDGVQVIREYDIEKMIYYMNKR